MFGSSTAAATLMLLPLLLLCVCLSVSTVMCLFLFLFLCPSAFAPRVLSVSVYVLCALLPRVLVCFVSLTS